MIAPSPRRVLAAALSAALLCFSASADALNNEIWSCAQGVVTGRATLMQDLDCSGSFSEGISIGRGTLDLNGHTLVTPVGFSIVCAGSCKVVGPGTITGEGSGIHANGTLKIVGVDIALTQYGGIAASSTGNISLDHVTISGATVGAVTQTKNVKVIDSTIDASVVGVLSGASNDGSPCLKAGSVLLRRSSVTGADPMLCASLDPPGANCADVLSCRRPKLDASTCGTSCQGGTGVPCASWGVCSAD